MSYEEALKESLNLKKGDEVCILFRRTPTGPAVNPTTGMPTFTVIKLKQEFVRWVPEEGKPEIIVCKDEILEISWPLKDLVLGKEFRGERPFHLT